MFRAIFGWAYALALGLVGAIASLAVGATLGVLLAERPDGPCGLPLIGPTLLGAIAGLIAFASGLHFVESGGGGVIRAASTGFFCLAFPGFALALLALARADFGTALRFVAGTGAIGILAGMLGGSIGTAAARYTRQPVNRGDAESDLDGGGGEIPD